MIHILIGGDIYPSGRIQKSFIEGDAKAIFHDLLEEIESADLSVVNLECPMVSRDTPIYKPGGVLGSSVQTINGFIAAKWDILNLANNHSFDHGAVGLAETIQTIRKAGLTHIGAGLNIEEARKPFIKEIQMEKIVIYSMAEREYSIADEKTPGANPLDLINFVDAIRRYKQQGIFIALVHGGKEFYPYPSPEMVRRCRFMVDMGADAVVCCHTHCPLPWEFYSGKPIIYGLGNLIFEPLQDVNASWHEGYLAKLSIAEKQVNFEPIPYLQSREKLGVRKMDNPARRSFVVEMEQRGAQLKDSAFLEDQWLNYCLHQKEYYLSWLFGYKKPMRKFRKLFLPLLHSREEMQRALLLAQCETHREILNAIFKEDRQHP